MFLTVALLAVIVGVAEMYLSDDTHTISQVSTNQKVVALTIDDGPHYKVTPEILALLREKHVKATFFVLGVNAKQAPTILAQEVADGHEIGMHTYSHPILTTLSSQKSSMNLIKPKKRFCQSLLSRLYSARLAAYIILE
jgi:peptidoglycan/xylan/chitin deacetylase (PgdA/CDA1 family)